MIPSTLEGGISRALPTMNAQWQRKENVMNREEVSWLLETIKDPERVQRFLLAQYERGRISLQVMADSTQERDQIKRMMQFLTSVTDRSTEYSTSGIPVATAW